MSNELRAPTADRNGGYVLDRVVLEYDNAGTRMVWNDDDGQWEVFTAYSADHAISLSEQTIFGSTYYAANMPAGAGAHTITPKYFQVGDALADAGHVWGGDDTIAWSGTAVVDVTAIEGADIGELEDRVEALEQGGGGGGSISPVTSAVSPGYVRPQEITAYRGESKTWVFIIVDDSGEPVSEAGDTLRFYVTDIYGAPAFDVGGSVGGEDNNQITVTASPSNLATSGLRKFALWNQTHNVLRAHGPLRIADRAAA